MDKMSKREQRRMNIRQKRISLGLTLEEVACHLPYSCSCISAWERGERDNPDFETMYTQFLNDCETGKIRCLTSWRLKIQRLGKAIKCIVRARYGDNEEKIRHLNAAKDYLNAEIKMLETAK